MARFVKVNKQFLRLSSAVIQYKGMMNNLGGNELSNANHHWKNRCLGVIKQAEKWNFPEHGVKSEMSDLIKKKEEAEGKLRLILSGIEKMEKKSNELNLKIGENTGPSSSELKLYKLITKITFDIESPPNELKGYVTGRPLRTFHLDTTKLSNQDIVNHLWHLIDPDSV